MRQINVLTKKRDLDIDRYILAVGELWYSIKDDPALDGFNLTELAPNFQHGVEYLNNCAYIWFHRDRRDIAAKFAVACDYQLKNLYEPYRSRELLTAHSRGRLSRRSVIAPIRQTLGDHTDATTTNVADRMALPRGGELILANHLAVLPSTPDRSVELVNRPGFAGG